MEHIDLTDPDYQELMNSEDIQVSRYATCMLCSNLQKNPGEMDQCGLCGCGIVHIVMFNFKRCPIDKWKN